MIQILPISKNERLSCWGGFRQFQVLRHNLLSDWTATCQTFCKGWREVHSKVKPGLRWNPPPPASSRLPRLNGLKKNTHIAPTVTLRNGVLVRQWFELTSTADDVIYWYVNSSDGSLKVTRTPLTSKMERNMAKRGCHNRSAAFCFSQPQNCFLPETLHLRRRWRRGRTFRGRKLLPVCFTKAHTETPKLVLDLQFSAV